MFPVDCFQEERQGRFINSACIYLCDCPKTGRKIPALLREGNVRHPGEIFI